MRAAALMDRIPKPPAGTPTYAELLQEWERCQGALQDLRRCLTRREAAWQRQAEAARERRADG